MSEITTYKTDRMPAHYLRDKGFPPARGAPHVQKQLQQPGPPNLSDDGKGWLHEQVLHMRDGPPMAFIARGSVFTAVKERRVNRRDAETRRETLAPQRLCGEKNNLSTLAPLR